MPGVFVNFHMHSDLHFVANPKATILFAVRFEEKPGSCYQLRIPPVPV